MVLQAKEGSGHVDWRDAAVTRSDVTATHLFRLDLVISFFNAAPSSGLSNSKEHSRSSETDMTAPKFCGRQLNTP